MATAAVSSLGSDDGCDRSERLKTLHQDASKQNQDLKGLGRSVYRQCWEEFYNWEPHACQQFIGELSAPYPSDSVGFDEYNGVLVSYGFTTKEYIMDLDVDDTSPVCTVRIYDTRNSYADSRLSFEEVEVVTIAPYPTYESCPPSSRSMTNRAYEPTEQYETPFIPYADEGDFDVVEYQTECQWLSWQVDWRDPDLEVIRLEAARRLHFEHGLSFADIDGLKFLGILRVNNQSGLLWDNFQRDILRWPGAQLSYLPEFTTTFEGDQAGESITHNALKDDLRARVNSLLRTFCPSLNCVQSACPTHVSPYPDFDAIKPMKTTQEMLDGDPCGDECFRRTGDNFPDHVYWDNPTDETTLDTILDITPDLLPCELAVLCRKPCREVYAQRKKLHPDILIIDSRAFEVTRSRTFRPPIFEDMRFKPLSGNGNLDFTPIFPCHHKGLCDPQSNCSCYLSNLHCTRNCRCNWNCKIRWKACACKKKHKRCTEKCKCAQAGRECDVDICKECGARALAAGQSKTKCYNITIQQGKAKTLVIRRGKWGLGAFAGCNITPDDYLGEYVGKLFNKENYTPFTAANHRGLNYNFTLNDTQVIDAVACGNNTRYINHGSGATANCEARIYFVNGDHRIGFFAIKKISAGREILFDYGKDYWQHHGHPPI